MSETSWLQQFNFCHSRSWHYILAWINVCLKTLVITRIVKAAVNCFISYAYLIDLIKAFTGQRNFWANIWSMHHEGKILACQKAYVYKFFINLLYKLNGTTFLAPCLIPLLIQCGNLMNSFAKAMLYIFLLKFISISAINSSTFEAIHLTDGAVQLQRCLRNLQKSLYLYVI